MCLAKLYQDNDRGEPILDEIAHARFEGDKVVLQTLLGETKVFHRRVQEIDFMDSRIVLKGEPGL